MYRQIKDDDFASTRKVFRTSNIDSTDNLLRSITRVSFKSNSQIRCVTRTKHSILRFMTLVLYATGINDFPRNRQRRRLLNCNIIILIFCAWNLIMFVLILSIISQCLNVWVYKDVKLFLSSLLLHSFNIVIRIVLTKNRKKFGRLILYLHSVKYIKNIRSLICQQITFTACVLIIVVVRNILCLGDMSLDDFNETTDINCFHIRWQNHPKVIPSIIIIFWISTEGIFPPAFATVYILCCYVLKKEFDFTSNYIKQCKNVHVGRRIFSNYSKDLEIGKAIDSIFSSSMFFVIVYMMVTIFYRGYKILLEKETDAFEVSFYGTIYYCK